MLRVTGFDRPLLFLVQDSVVRDNSHQAVASSTLKVARMGRTQSKSDRVVAVEMDEVLRHYEQELISLGRLAELLGIDREQAMALVSSRGLPLRLGPNTAEEALEELRVIERLEAR